MTAFEDKCPLNIFSFLNFMITKSTKPQIDILNIKTVYHCILQVHSILCTGLAFFFVATTPTSFICCKARLVTKVLSFLCLHNIFMTTVVTSNEIITVANRKSSNNIVVEKEIFVRQI